MILDIPDFSSEFNVGFGIGSNVFVGFGEFPPGRSNSSVFFGYNINNGEIEMYDIGLENNVRSPSVFVLNDKAYIVGGLRVLGFQGYSVGDVWEFDPSKPEF